MHRLLLGSCLVVLLGGVSLSSHGHAKESVQPSQGTPAPKAARCAWLLETDPATFALHGFAAHLRIKPRRAPNWTFGLGAYALNFPALLVDLDAANRNEGWTTRISLGTSAFIDRYFREDGQGLFVGAQLGAQRYRITRSGAAGSAEYTSLLAMPRVGYTWQPFKAGFYLMPWAGVGALAKLTRGAPRVGGAAYHTLPVVAFATLHVGFRFD